MTSRSCNGQLPVDARSAAAYYLDHGYVPVPIPRVGRCKAPTLEGWQSLRPAREDLDRLFPDGDRCNIGLLVGEPSGGLIDVDLDTAEAVAAGPFLLQATGWVSGHASKPASHWWYRVEQPVAKAQDPYRDLDGAMLVEVHSTRWQVVVPPGVHESGEPIVWHTFTQPADAEMSQVQAAARAVAAVALLARHWPSQGTRQDCFLALVGGLLRAGWASERVERFVEALAAATRDEESRKRVQTVNQTAAKQEQDQKTTGWPKLQELLGSDGPALVRRVRTWLGLAQGAAPAAPTTSARTAPAAKKARILEPYRPFPVEALPQPLAEYVRQGALALGCDPAYLALPGLVVLASAIGNTRTLLLKRGWEEPCIVWAGIVGDSGTLKSPAYLKMVAYLFRVQKRLLEEFKRRLSDYEDELEEYKDAKRKAKKEEGDDPGDPPERPVLQRVVCSDTTVEKLAEILEDNSRGTLVARDELHGWLGSFTRYKGKQGGTDLPNWLEMFRAGTLVVDRKTSERQTLFIHRAAVSVTGGIQPGVLARVLTADFLDAGLAARLLLAMPPKTLKRWSEDEIEPDVERAYENVVDRLLALDFEVSEDGQREPYVLKLSAEAKTAWVTFYRAWAREQSAAEGELAAAYSKLEAYAARFALLHHIVTHVHLDTDDRRPVGPRSIEAGIALVRWFAREARRIYRMLSESEDQRDTRRLLEFIQGRGGQITIRELMRANCRRFPNAEAAEAALTGLVDEQQAEWVDVPTTMKGGKPIKGVRLCMTHDTDDTVTDPEEEVGLGAHDTAADSGADTAPSAPAVESPPPGSSDYSGGACVEPAQATSPNGVIGVMRHAQVGEQEQLGGSPADQCHAPEAESPISVIRSIFVGKARGNSPAPYQFVRGTADLTMVVNALDHSALVGLDLETTGLDPRRDRIRLLALSCDTIDGGRFNYLVDCNTCDPTPLWPLLAEKELVLHNAAFDLGFLARVGFRPGKVHDTMLLAQLLTAGAGGRVSLEACCERWLQRPLDKTCQKSDWSGELTPAQLAYAATDTDVLVPLLEALREQVRVSALERAAEIEHRCLPAVVWMAQQGIVFDRDAWETLAQRARADAERLAGELDALAPAIPNQLPGGRWGWDSPVQARQALELAGCSLKNTADETLAGLSHPLARRLRDYREARKRASTYGTDWLSHVQADGRIYPHWRQMGAKTGRMACGTPNLQNIPRNRDYRRCFRAPPGRVWIKADYSQIELRLAAKIAQEAKMMDAYRQGADLHALTAQQMTGRAEVTKEERQLAKPVNFGLIYGLGAASLRRKAKTDYGLELSAADAHRYRRAFLAAYPGIQRWHEAIRRARSAETRTLTGRRVLVQPGDFFGGKANYMVQGSGGDGIKLALALLWERRHEVPGAFPVLAIHDEIVLECEHSQAEAAQAWLQRAMVDAMAPLLDPVPVGVDVAVAQTWGGD